MLPYHAFYDTLAALGDANTDEWQATMAGLLVLRLVHDWLDFAGLKHLTKDASFATARTLIADLPSTKAIKPQRLQSSTE